MTDPQPLTDTELADLPDPVMWDYAADVPELAARLLVTLNDARAERDELRIAIHGGCGCPAPYTECPHDEPLLPALNNARTKLAAAVAERDALRTERDALWDMLENNPCVVEGHPPLDSTSEADK